MSNVKIVLFLSRLICSWICTRLTLVIPVHSVLALLIQLISSQFFYVIWPSCYLVQECSLSIYIFNYISHKSNFLSSTFLRLIIHHMQFLFLFLTPIVGMIYSTFATKLPTGLPTGCKNVQGVLYKHYPKNTEELLAYVTPSSKTLLHAKML